MSAAWRVRAAGLTLLGALVVHQGRYLAFPRAEDHHAHAYFEWLVPALVAVGLLLLAEFGVRLTRGRAGAAPSLPPRGVLWIAATSALLTIFAAQECAEALVTHGELPALGAGGWTAVPLALACGLGIALLLQGAALAVRWARRPHLARERAPKRLRLPLVPLLPPRASVMARRLAGRAPPSVA